jgi:raffinose/stachyose/melibiose transport system permease protein
MKFFSNNRMKQNFETGLVVRNPYLRYFNYALMTLFIIMIFLPISIVFMTSFKTNEEYIYSAVWALPENFFNFDNYKEYFSRAQMLTGFKNIVFMTVISVTLGIAMGTMVSYVITRFKFRFKKLLLFSFILASIVPTTTTAIVIFILVKSLGVYNTIWAGTLLFTSTSVLDIYLFMQFMYKIPLELDQSARIDGANYFRVYWSIMLPLMKPAITTIAILKIVFIYNDFFIPILYMPDRDLVTVTSGLRLFTTDRLSQWNVLSAGIFAVLIPPLVVYVIAQRFIVAGVSQGAVKS